MDDDEESSRSSIILLLRLLLLIIQVEQQKNEKPPGVSLTDKHTSIFLFAVHNFIIRMHSLDRRQREEDDEEEEEANPLFLSSIKRDLHKRFNTLTIRSFKKKKSEREEKRSAETVTRPTDATLNCLLGSHRVNRRSFFCRRVLLLLIIFLLSNTAAADIVLF